MTKGTEMNDAEQRAALVPGSISAVINTRNAALHLDKVLSAVAPWVDQIVVADMDSSDNTVAIALRHGAVIVSLPALGFPEAGIPAALEAATGEWVIRIDADEIVPRPLAERLVEVVGHNEADVVFVPRRNWLAGRPFEHGSFGPDNDRVPRFFRQGFMEHVITIHGHHRPAEAARVLQLADEEGWRARGVFLEHFSYLGVGDLVTRAVRYSGNEAEQMASASRRRAFFRSLVYIPVELFGRMAVKRGWKDGRVGILMAANSALYSAIRAMHLAQRLWFADDDEILRIYEQRAQELQAAWEHED